MGSSRSGPPRPPCWTGRRHWLHLTVAEAALKRKHKPNPRHTEAQERAPHLRAAGQRNVRGLQSAIVCGMAKLAASCGGFAASAAFAGDREGLLGVACDYTRARSKTQKKTQRASKN